MSGQSVIELERVTRRYLMGATVVLAVRELSLTIERGEMVAVIGPSGSGKSTLMNILGCLDTPDRGRYTLAGEDVGALTDDSLAAIRNRRIGFVFQSYNLLPGLTALENVALPLRYRRGAKAPRRQAFRALARVGLADRASHRPNQLSGGQQQRVAIARALVSGPEIILADEPTGNLDTRSGEEIMGVLQALNQETGMTVLVVTHDPEVARACERIVGMRDGQIETDEAVAGRRLFAPPAPRRNALPCGGAAQAAQTGAQ